MPVPSISPSLWPLPLLGPLSSWTHTHYIVHSMLKWSSSALTLQRDVLKLGMEELVQGHMAKRTCSQASSQPIPFLLGQRGHI